MKSALVLETENYVLRRGLERLRDCDWVISLPDRMDAVREVARDTLETAGKVEALCAREFVKEFYCMDGCGNVVVSEFPTRCSDCARLYLELFK